MSSLPDKIIDVVFFGTHEFAVEILRALVHDPAIRVVGVVTQPDRPVGRKQTLQAPPVKIFAEQHNLSLSQPLSLKGYALEYGTHDLNIVAQYGKLIPQHIIETPKHGTINVHTSLLPKYRGASPIQAALLNGETETGVTIMLMDVGLDTGPILTQQKIEIPLDQTCGELEKRLAIIGGQLLLQTIPRYISGEIKPQAQRDADATHCKQLTRDEGRVDWKSSAGHMYNQFRALTPWPGLWTTWESQRIKLLQIIPSEHVSSPGVVFIDKNRLFVGCKDESIEILHLQREGKNPSSAADFIKGYPKLNDAVFS